MPRPTSLLLAMPINTSTGSSTVTSPTEGASDLSSPTSNSANRQPSGAATRHHKSSKSLPFNSSRPQSPIVQPASPEITSLPAFPPSPTETPKHAREASKGFFSNLKASKSSNKVHNIESTIRQVSDNLPRAQTDSQHHPLYSLQKSSGSTPDLSLSRFDINSSDHWQGRSIQRKDIPNRPIVASIDSDSAIVPSPTKPASNLRKPKPRFSNLIGRTRSTRLDQGGRRSKPSTPISAAQPGRRMQYDGSSDNDDPRGAPRTAPLNPNQSLRDMMNSGIRGRSADRQSSNHSSENGGPRRTGPSSSTSNSNSNLSSTVGTLRDGAGSHLFANIKNTSTKAADGLGRAGKGLFSKMNRRPSNTDREDEPYVLQVINLPLVEQTRRTRIAHRLEDSKDKTEFWMPALPWRCIDYLNFRGCEEEGLYRVPGSDLQIRRWQKRFDLEGDINLFDEGDLHDINIIGSMFKAWLRGLPTEILPKAVQAKVAMKCADAEQVPQQFKDELSMLPPWNYYLLFAITCHLSLLTAYSDKNKMTYNNLCICFQPALRIDAYCFNFLVNQWRDCWQGCHTETDALQDEYRFLDGLSSSSGESSNGSTALVEEQPLESGQRPSLGRTNQGRPPALNLIRASDESPPTTPVRLFPEQNGHVTQTSRLPEIEPVQPMSPLMSEY